ncbi:MAG TPA: tetratricopeptide repeat protein [Fimbriimonas sp.]
MTLLDDLWDFSDPDLSESRFREALADDRFERSEVLTQIARTYSLRGRYPEARHLLSEAERHPHSNRASVRILLEIGRCHNSAGEKQHARCLFVQAWQAALDLREDALAVDSAHMVAITHSGDPSLEWNRRALALAEASLDPRARRWMASLHNNLGWVYHDDYRDYPRALVHFERSLAARAAQGDPEAVRIARWAVARCLRSLGRHDQALEEQQRLLDEGGAGDGYVHEEIAECLVALGRETEADPYFRQAYDLLSADPWFSQNEPDRLARLQLASR